MGECVGGWAFGVEREEFMWAGGRGEGANRSGGEEAASGRGGGEIEVIIVGGEEKGRKT